jgi:membrane dipeptidase
VSAAPLDAKTWAKELAISREAVELYLASQVVDLHLDSFIWSRVLGYELGADHRRPPLAGWFLGHADFPRVRQASLSAATWVITTNPLKEPRDRFETLLANLEQLEAVIRRSPADLVLARTYADYQNARASGRHAAFIGIQGGNALDGVADAVERLPPLAILRATLVHLSNSGLGPTSSPLGLGKRRGLSASGKELVRRLNAARIFVDLAHIAESAFWDAVDVQTRGVPLLVTHTGISGVHRHWRNLNDRQIRAVAATGGVIGVMFHSVYLGDPLWAGRASRVVDHLEHLLRVGGEDTAALGSDFDGFIVPPRDLQSVLELPRLVELMLRRGFSAPVIQKILGGNFLRVLAEVRPG